MFLALPHDAGMSLVVNCFNHRGNWGPWCESCNNKERAKYCKHPVTRQGKCVACKEQVAGSGYPRRP